MSASDGTLAHLDEQRRVWETKPLIRTLYGHYHQAIAAECAPGPIVEIGAGCGNLKASVADITSLDIVPSEWVDLVADAQALPFGDATVTNLVMLDVLHHIPQPVKFLHECERVLMPGGRLVVLEPAITLASRLFYTYLHPEPVDMNVDVFAGEVLSGDDPFDSNQAIPTLLFASGRNHLADHFPQLALRKLDWLGPVSYPASGGFRPWQLLTPGLLKVCLALESALPAWLKRATAFRLLATMERV